MRCVDEGVYLQSYPLVLLGCNINRVVTVLKLTSGKVLIHSSAEFDRGDRDAMNKIGDPCGLIEATNFHDTFTEAARQVFPDLPLYVPEGFPLSGLDASKIPVVEHPSEWGDDLVIVPIGGIPKLNEHAVYHRPSKTLIVADLLFNLQPAAGRWTLLFMRVMSGMKTFPARSRLFNLCIKDQDAFRQSMQEIADLDFNKIIVGHGEPITDRAKDSFVEVFLR